MRLLAALVDLETTVRKHHHKTDGSPSKSGEPAQPRATGLRSRRINLDVSESEVSKLDEMAKAAGVPLRYYVRETALGRLSKATKAKRRAQPVLSKADFDAAAILAATAGDLTRLADAAAAGIVTGVSPDLFRDLSAAAHLLGLRHIGARAGVR